MGDEKIIAVNLALEPLLKSIDQINALFRNLSPTIENAITKGFAKGMNNARAMTTVKKTTNVVNELSTALGKAYDKFKKLQFMTDLGAQTKQLRAVSAEIEYLRDRVHRLGALSKHLDFDADAMAAEVKQYSAATEELLAKKKRLADAEERLKKQKEANLRLVAQEQAKAQKLAETQQKAAQKAADAARKSAALDAARMQAPMAGIAAIEGMPTRGLTEAQVARYSGILRKTTNQLIALRNAGKITEAQFVSLTNRMAENGRVLARQRELIRDVAKAKDTWFKRFGMVALGFTVAYRAMNAFERGIRATIDLMRDSVIVSGEAASLQGELATYYALATRSVDDFSEAMMKASVNVDALYYAATTAVGTMQELTTGFSELAQHGYIIQPEEVKTFTAINDLLVLIAKSTGDNVRQVRSEWQGLMEGQMRAQNAMVRMLARLRILTDEDIKSLKTVGDKTAVVKKIFEEAGPAAIKLQEAILKADPAKAIAKWRSAMTLGMATAIRDLSKEQKMENIFGDIIFKHIERINKLFYSTEAQDTFKKSFEGIAQALDNVLNLFEYAILNINTLISAVISLGRNLIGITVILASTKAIYGAVTAITALAKAFKTLDLALIPAKLKLLAVGGVLAAIGGIGYGLLGGQDVRDKIEEETNILNELITKREELLEKQERYNTNLSKFDKDSKPYKVNEALLAKNKAELNALDISIKETQDALSQLQADKPSAHPKYWFKNIGTMLLEGIKLALPEIKSTMAELEKIFSGQGLTIPEQPNYKEYEELLKSLGETGVDLQSRLNEAVKAGDIDAVSRIYSAGVTQMKLKVIELNTELENLGKNLKIAETGKIELGQDHPVNVIQTAIIDTNEKLIEAKRRLNEMIDFKMMAQLYDYTNSMQESIAALNRDMIEGSDEYNDAVKAMTDSMLKFLQSQQPLTAEGQKVWFALYDEIMKTSGALKHLKDLSTNFAGELKDAISEGVDVSSLMELAKKETLKQIKEIEDRILSMEASEFIFMSKGQERTAEAIRNKIIELKYEVDKLRKNLLKIDDAPIMAELTRVTDEYQNKLVRLRFTHRDNEAAFEKAAEEARNTLKAQLLGMQGISEETRLAIMKAFNELIEKSKDLDEVWENTRNAIQNAISGFMGDALKGEFEDFKEYFKSFANSLTDIWTTQFAEQFMKGGIKGINELTLQLGVLSNAMQAIQQGGVGAASIGLGTGLGALLAPTGQGWLGAAIGGTAGGMLGGMFGGKSEFDTYLKELKENTEALNRSTEATLSKVFESFPGQADVSQIYIDATNEMIEVIKKLPGGTFGIPKFIKKEMIKFIEEGDLEKLINVSVEGDFKEVWDSIAAIAKDALTSILENAIQWTDTVESEMTSWINQLDSLNLGEKLNALFSAEGLDFRFPENALQQAQADFAKSTLPLLDTIKMQREELMKSFALATTPEDKQKIAEAIDKLDAFKVAIGAIGDAITEHFKNLRSDVFEDIKNYIDDLKGSVSTFTTVMDKVNDDFDSFIDSLKDAGATVNELTRAENRRTQALQQAAAQYKKEAKMSALPLMKELGAISPEQFYKQMLNTLMRDYQSIDSNDWTQQISLLSQMNSLLSEIQGTLEQQLSAQIAAIRSIDKMILDLTGGNLAAVQSIEFFEVFYDTLLKKALGGAPEDVNEYLGFIKEYADFAKLYGGDYAAFTKSLVEDLYQVRDAVAQGASLADLESQLKIIADNTVDLSKLPVSFEDLTAEIQKVYDAITTTSIADMIEPFLNVNEVIVTEATIPTATIENAVFSGNLVVDASQMRPEVYAAYMASIGATKTYAKGGKTTGLSIAGESGPEWVIPTYEPERTSFLKDIGMSPDAIASGIARVLSPMLSQGGDIHVPVIIDGREIAYVVAKQIKYGHGDLIDNIRMVN